MTEEEEKESWEEILAICIKKLSEVTEVEWKTENYRASGRATVLRRYSKDMFENMYSGTYSECVKWVSGYTSGWLKE